MRWLVFIIFGVLTMTLDAGLGNLLSIGQITPSFLLILAVFVGLSAPASAMPWALLFIGLLSDIMHPVPVDDLRDVIIIGPACLGYLVGAFAIIGVRGMIFRDSALTMAVLVVFVGLFINLMTVFMLSLRGVSIFTGEPIPGWTAVDQLVHRFLQLLYSGVLAIPLGLLLYRTERLWNFDTDQARRRRGMTR